MAMSNMEKAKRILTALDNGKVPISWHCIDEPDLLEIINAELNRIEREENNEKRNI